MQNRFETFTVLIAKINRNIRKLKNREMAEYGLKSAHISCLYYLYLSPGLAASELCERCEEDKATISRAIEYLESKGYVTRTICQDKGYKTPILLTDIGKETGKRVFDKVSLILDEVGKELSEEERIAFYHGLNVISDCIEKIGSRL